MAYSYTVLMLTFTLQKALKPRLFIATICQRFLSFHEQSYALDMMRLRNSKGSVNLWSVSLRNRKARRTILLHSSLINSRTPHGVFEEIGQLAGL